MKIVGHSCMFVGLCTDGNYFPVVKPSGYVDLAVDSH